MGRAAMYSAVVASAPGLQIPVHKTRSRGEAEGGRNLHVQVMQQTVHKTQAAVEAALSTTVGSAVGRAGTPKYERAASTGAGRTSARTAARATASTGTRAPGAVTAAGDISAKRGPCCGIERAL